MSDPFIDTEAASEEASAGSSLPEWPGFRLRRVREERKMSREEVASRLHLRVQLIAALEDNEEAKLPPATYVGGYIRSYARFLDLPVEELVAGYEGFLQSEPAISNVQDRSQVSSRDLPVRLVTYLIVLAIGAFLAKSLFFSEQATEQAAGPVSTQPAAGSPAEGAEGTEGAYAGVAPATGTGETAASSAEPQPSAQDAGGVEAQGQADGADTAERGTAAETADPEAEAKETAAPEAVKKTERVVISPLGADVPQSELVLQFETDCWTDVQDAAGRKLIYRLVKGGQTLTLRGEAPFRVFLGYAPGATVRYNGAAVDTTPYRRQDMARFTLGKAADNRVPSR